MINSHNSHFFSSLKFLICRLEPFNVLSVPFQFTGMKQFTGKFSCSVLNFLRPPRGGQEEKGDSEINLRRISPKPLPLCLTCTVSPLIHHSPSRLRKDKKKKKEEFLLSRISNYVFESLFCALLSIQKVPSICKMCSFPMENLTILPHTSEQVKRSLV